MPLILGGFGFGFDVFFNGLHFHHELTCACTDFIECVAHQWQVPGEDAVSDVPVGRTEAEHKIIVVERDDVLKGGKPYRVRNLRTEELCDGCPHLFRVAHQHLLENDAGIVHSVVHTMWIVKHLLVGSGGAVTLAGLGTAAARRVSPERK